MACKSYVAGEVHMFKMGGLEMLEMLRRRVSLARILRLLRSTSQVGAVLSESRSLSVNYFRFAGTSVPGPFLPTGGSMYVREVALLTHSESLGVGRNELKRA